MKRIAFLFVLLLSSCYLRVDHPPCSVGVQFHNAPRDAAYWVSRTCTQYAQRTGRDPYSLLAAMEGVEFRYYPTAPCGPGCASLEVATGQITVSIDRSNRAVSSITAHETAHVLLWLFEPELEPREHHRRMQQLGLCANGCRYGVREWM
jgi:hypothetical protein